MGSCGKSNGTTIQHAIPPYLSRRRRFLVIGGDHAHGTTHKGDGARVSTADGAGTMLLRVLRCRSGHSPFCHLPQQITRSCTSTLSACTITRVCLRSSVVILVKRWPFMKNFVDNQSVKCAGMLLGWSKTPIVCNSHARTSAQDAVKLG